MAGAGAVVAFGPTLAACAGAAASPSPTAAPPQTATPAGTPGSTPGTTTAPTAEPTPAPSPEGELFVYNWDEYIGENTIQTFEDKYGIKVTYDTFTNYEEMTTKISTGNSGYDITFATGVNVPGFLARSLVLPLDVGQIPNIVNLGPEWQNPATTRATSIRSPTCGGRRASATTRRRSTRT